MSQIGLLFKELNDNESILKILKDVESLQTIEVDIVVERIYCNEELMNKLRVFCDDESFLKKKILVSVGQSISKILKNRKTVKDADKMNINEIINPGIEICLDNNYEKNEFLGKYNKEKDKTNSKVQWITEWIRLETVDHLIKMTTSNFEVFY